LSPLPEQDDKNNKGRIATMILRILSVFIRIYFYKFNYFSLLMKNRAPIISILRKTW